MTQENFGQYKKKSLVKTISTLVILWAQIALTIFVAIKIDSLFTLILAIPIIGSRQHALGILSHDATHWLLCENRKLNDFLGNFFCSWPLFYSLEGFRYQHLPHHRAPNSKDDPDWTRRLGHPQWTFPMQKSKLLTIFALDLLGLNTFQFIKRYKDAKKVTKKKKASARELQLHWFLLFILLLTTCLTIISSWKYFFLYWTLPFLTWFKFIRRIRAIVEHFGARESYRQQNTRTILLNPLESFLVMPLNVNYHLEHHLIPNIPWYHLRKVHQYYLENDREFKQQAHLTYGLWPTLKEVITSTY
jgi:fatty acid desaturase